MPLLFMVLARLRVLIIRSRLSLLCAVVVFTAALAAMHLAVGSGYGGDGDTYGILYSFLSMAYEGVYVPSRYTGYPVAELAIGVLAWFGGSALSNCVTYLLFILSAALFPCAVGSNRFGSLHYWFFAAMALSSPILTFDNIQSIDYSWALFFWVLGSVILRLKPYLSLCTIPFALSIGSRPSFALFVILSIWIICIVEPAEAGTQKKHSAYLAAFSILSSSLFAAALFYIPIWISSKFSFSWLTAASPDAQGHLGIIARFFYKLFISIGIYQSALIILTVVLFWLRARPSLDYITGYLKTNKLTLPIAIIIANLLIFMRLPIELSYLQPFLLCMYWVIALIAKSKFKWLPCAIIFFNIYNWFWMPQILQISHRDPSLCASVVASQASIRFSYAHGKLAEFFESQDKVICYLQPFRDIHGIDFSLAISSRLPLREVD